MNIPQGFSLSSGSLGLRQEKDMANNFLGKNEEKKDDSLLILAEDFADVALVTTQNKFCGAPVEWNKKQMQEGKKIKALFVNTVFANAGTGRKGYQNAENIAHFLSESLDCNLQNILLASTGKIGPQLPVSKFITGIPNILSEQDNDIERAGKAILTTDLVPKIIFRTLKNGAILLALCKGSGMIAPDMATMLSFVMTDAKIDVQNMSEKWREVCDDSFNQVSVDNCESTSDMSFLLSSQKIETEEKEFWNALSEITQELAQKIAADGEGATHLIEVEVQNAQTKKEAQILAKSVVTSDLLKAAVAGHDSNWGRICSALGSTKIDFDPGEISIFLDGQPAYIQGESIKICHPEKIFQEKKVCILIDMSRGKKSAKAWGCDLTEEYIRINAEYST